MSLTKGLYENHYYALGEPIRNMVKQGQELLCAIEYGYERQKHLDFWDKYWTSREARYPQSLGELCIELAQERLSNLKTWAEERFPGNKQLPVGWPQYRRDIQTLREHLYCKAPPMLIIRT